MSLLENIIKKLVLEEAIIEYKEQLSPSIYLIRIKNETIKKAEFVPGYFLRVGIGIDNNALTMKDKIRSYSVWDLDRKNGTIDLAVSTESGGSGANWAANCKIGEKIYFKWKKGNFIIDKNADSYLMIGDLSALSHLYVINRNLPKAKQVESLIYSQNPNNIFDDLNGERPFNVHNLGANDIDKIIALAKSLSTKMSGIKIVYIAGDSRVCLALNQYFRKELNWNTKQIKTKPFWNPEKKGLE